MPSASVGVNSGKEGFNTFSGLASTLYERGAVAV